MLAHGIGVRLPWAGNQLRLRRAGEERLLGPEWGLVVQIPVARIFILDLQKCLIHINQRGDPETGARGQKTCPPDSVKPVLIPRCKVVVVMRHFGRNSI